MKSQRGRSESRSDIASRSCRQLLERVNQLARDLERDERRLRERIRQLALAGQIDEAIGLLTEWDDKPASDVLQRTAMRGHPGK